MGNSKNVLASIDICINTFKNIGMAIKVEENLDEADGVLLSLFSSLIRKGQAIATLLDKNLKTGTKSLVRSSLENKYYIDYITKDNCNDRALAYAYASEVNNLYNLNNLRKSINNLKGNLVDNSELINIFDDNYEEEKNKLELYKIKYDELFSKYHEDGYKDKSGNKWYSLEDKGIMSIFHLASNLGIDDLLQYHFIYSSYSKEVHVSNGIDYILEEEDQLSIGIETAYDTDEIEDFLYDILIETSVCLCVYYEDLLINDFKIWFNENVIDILKLSNSNEDNKG